MQSLDSAVQLVVERLEKSKRQLRQRQSENLADRLFPELAGEFPATALVKFAAQSEGRVLSADTALDSSHGSTASDWRLADEVHLHPFDVIGQEAGPASSDWAPLPKGTQALLRLHLSAAEESLSPRRIRVHLVGKQEYRFALFQMLCCSLAGVFARDESGAAVAISCEPAATPHSLFATPPGLPAESRLLNDFFLHSERFTAFDLGDFPAVTGTIEVVFAFSTQVPDLPSDLIQTRCSTIINEVVRELPLLEVDPTRDEWELTLVDGEKVHSLVRVQTYDRDSGRWNIWNDWQLVCRNGRSMIAFRSPLFEPIDPPSRFVKVLARCFQSTVCLNRGDEVETEGAEQARVLRRASPPIKPVRGSLTRWTASGFREPLTNKSFSRMLEQQAVLDGDLPLDTPPCELSRREASRKLLSGISLLSVIPDRYINEHDEVHHGRRVTIAIDPEQFPGKGYWVFVLVVARFLAAQSPFNQFTRLAISVAAAPEETLLPPMFGRRNSA